MSILNNPMLYRGNAWWNWIQSTAQTGFMSSTDRNDPVHSVLRLNLKGTNTVGEKVFFLGIAIDNFRQTYYARLYRLSHCIKPKVGKLSRITNFWVSHFTVDKRRLFFLKWMFCNHETCETQLIICEQIFDLNSRHWTFRNSVVS